MQTDLTQFIHQPTLTEFLEIDQKPTSTEKPMPTLDLSRQRTTAAIEGLLGDIEDRKARLAELQKEIDDAKRDVENVIESEDGDNDLFHCYGLTSETDWQELAFINETEIALLKLEIGELEAKLKHLRGEHVR